MSRGIVLYDYLYCRGGAEQVTLDMARGLPETDICVAFREKDVFRDDELHGITCHEVQRALKLNVAVWRTMSGLRAFSRDLPFLREYDWAVFSGSNAPAAVASRKGFRNFYYCHTIPRFAYDLFVFYYQQLPLWKKPFFTYLTSHVRAVYEQSIRGMDLLIANSENVRQRIKKHIGLEALVVNPPCNVTEYAWRGQGDYYLSTARMQRYKRVELIIEAFLQMPDKKLVVASGGSDEPWLRRISGSAQNIFFAGWQTDAQLRELVGNCIASIYISRDEDFGMSPVESMAAGKPVIGVAEGGLLETVVPGETGLLLRPNPGVDDLVSAVNELTPKRAGQMRRACETRSSRFSREIFLERMRGILEI